MYAYVTLIFCLCLFYFYCTFVFKNKADHMKNTPYVICSFIGFYDPIVFFFCFWFLVFGFFVCFLFFFCFFCCFSFVDKDVRCET
jgi:hypothetical protein